MMTFKNEIPAEILVPVSFPDKPFPILRVIKQKICTCSDQKLPAGEYCPRCYYLIASQSQIKDTLEILR